MTDEQFQLLEFIHKNQPVHWIDVLNNFDPNTSATLYDSELSKLLDGRLIRLVSPASGKRLSTVTLTPTGAVTFLAAKEKKSNAACVDNQQCEADVSKKRKIDFSGILNGLRSIGGFVKVILEILRLLPL